MGRIKAVAFDFDQTLCDGRTTVERAAASLALELPAHRPDFVSAFTVAAKAVSPDDNPGPIHLNAERLVAGVLGANVPVDRLAQRFRELMVPTAFPEVVEVLELLGHHYRLAILSNNPYAPTGVRVMGLAHHFETVIALDERSGRAKPHPAAFAGLITGLGLNPLDVLYVGDSLIHDIVGATSAGLTAAWVDRESTHTPLPAQAHRLDSLLDLPGLLGRL